MRSAVLALLMLGAALGSCRSAEIPEPPPPFPYPEVLSPPPPPPPPPNPVQGVLYVPVATILKANQSFTAEGGGYAIVLLRRSTPVRNNAACQAMLRSMGMRVGPADGRPILDDGFLVYQRPVYWPVTASPDLNCTRMMQNYDFGRAETNIRRISGWASLGNGPFVVVRRANGTQAGLFDFSQVTAQDFPAQFNAVVNYLGQSANVWDASFYHPATFRQRLRYYVIDKGAGATVVVARLVNFSGGQGSG